MAWLKGFTYDGIDSLDYDLYITSGSVYDAPERVVDMIKVPGRNGNLAIDRGKFENIDVEYNVYTKDRSQTSFAQNIRDFRNELCSRHEYLRLTDDYNSDEFRLGIYKSGLELDADIDRAGAIKLTFDCKPQRFLTSGETERSIPEWSDLHTDSGSLVTVDNSSGEYAVKSLSAGIVPQQDLNGYDNPWAGGAGKNLLLNTATTQTKNGVTFTFNADGSVKVNGTATSNAAVVLCDMKDFLTEAGTYTVSGCPSGGGNGKYKIECRVNSSSSWYGDDGSGVQINYVVNQNINQIRIIVYSGFTANNLMFYPMLEKGSTKTAFEPYENICPITGFSSTNIYVSPTTSVGDATTYNVSFGSAGTVYGGTLDVVSGQLTVTHKIISENDFYAVSSGTSGGGLHYVNVNSSGYPAATSSNSLSNMLVNNQSGWGSTTPCYTTNTSGNPIRVYGVFTTLAEFKTAYAGLQIVYELATPLTYQLTATQVALLLGTNNVWSDTGDIQIEYGKGGNMLINPTLFDSRPLLVVTGYGNLGIGSQTLTIENGYPSQVVYIDCESMEAWTMSGGVKSPANDLIQNAGDAFPVLTSGMNAISLASTISEVKITPRWWRI